MQLVRTLAHVAAIAAPYLVGAIGTDAGAPAQGGPR
jgi:hypothetical protein